MDLQSNLPSVFSEKDLKILLDLILTNQKQKDTVLIENFILSRSFVETLSKSCDDLVKEKANFIVESGRYQQYQTELLVSSSKPGKHDVSIKLFLLCLLLLINNYSINSQVEVEDTKVDKREERRKKAAGGKSGGGTQGRETKTKSTKKAGLKPKVVDNDSDYEQQPEKKAILEVVSFDDVKNVIENKLEEEGLDDLIDPLSYYILKGLNETGRELAATLYATTIVDRTANRRQTHNDVQNKLNILLGDIRLFDKGIKMFPADTQTQLHKHLMKTLCTDIVNEMFNYISIETGLSLPENLTNEQRTKFVNDLPVEYKSQMQTLIKTLSGTNIEEFMNTAEDALSSCSMILKKIDKKKDRILILNHKHGLLEQLNKCDDPALVLHLASLVVFVSAVGQILHASGKHVYSILMFLKQHLSSDQSSELLTYYGKCFMKHKELCE